MYLFPDRAPKPAPSKGDWETEYQACKAFDRPPRSILSDNPFYPWMPKQAPSFKVSFKLGFTP